MARVSVRLPPEILAALKKDASKKDLPLATWLRLVLAQRVWRKKRPTDKQSWLEGIYAGKARRKIKKFEDLFSD